MTNFDTFHAQNPRVYDILVALARDWVAKSEGAKLGIQTLYERARWEIDLNTAASDFKLNNSFTPYYARLIMLQEPDLNNLFHLRSAEADEWLDAQIAAGVNKTTTPEPRLSWAELARMFHPDPVY